MHDTQMKDRERTHFDDDLVRGAIADVMRSGLVASGRRQSIAASNANDGNAEVPTPEHATETEDWDDVYDQSWDSFPASDPPSWVGMRIGGPPRPSPAPDTVTQIVADGPSTIVESAARPFDSHWVAGQWPCVHICHAALHVDGPHAGRRPKLNAVVQLGELRPADVHVTARRIGDGSESAANALFRLWSVQSHRNGSYVFEAETHPDVLGDASQIGIVVQPARARTNARGLSDIVRHLSATESAECGSCARAALA